MSERLYALVLGPLLVVALVVLLVQVLPHTSIASAVSWSMILSATWQTTLRIAIAYFFALVIAVPLAVLVTENATVESILLPAFDVMESVPVLALFPVIILLFIRFNFLNGAAVFILFLAMLWNIVFTAVGGIKLIPKDVTAAAHVFGVSGFAFFRRLTLPAIFPQIVTGSILAVAQGWNIIIVAEVLHTYIPGGTSAQDLFGIGSVLVNAAANGQESIFLAAVCAMVVVIALFNFFIWQRLLHLSQRFRFD